MPALQPGDTPALLDYVGEGFYRAWHEDEILETQDFWSPQFERLGGMVSLLRRRDTAGGGRLL